MLPSSRQNTEKTMEKPDLQHKMGLGILVEAKKRKELMIMMYFRCFSNKEDQSQKENIN
uniref:Uncharacterized protein n=1 Tax=Anguilla anguilla TaxID=7936 RepID=A0A0E9SGM8_ANGAN